MKRNFKVSEFPCTTMIYDVDLKNKSVDFSLNDIAVFASKERTSIYIPREAYDKIAVTEGYLTVSKTFFKEVGGVIFYVKK